MATAEEQRKKAKLQGKKNVDIDPDRNKDRKKQLSDKDQGAALRETTAAKSKARTTKLNKEGRKGFKPAANLSDYSSQLKALLSNKDNLVGIDSGDGRNKYQVQINKLKKRMKAEGLKFSSLLRDVKKQEKAGTFDRGAEGKTKNALRKKLKTGPGSK
tara:strand:- start:41 stop:514 length:474 start_codon:yes stop_codon:yes gene_type:complete